MTSSHLDKALQRVLSIERPSGRRAKKSNIYLMAEYQRRDNLWKKEFGLRDYQPFCNIPKLIAPDVMVPESTLKLLDERPLGIHGRGMGKRYLHWAKLKDEGIISQSELPDLYEPLICILERGDDLLAEGGMVYVAEVAIPYDYWKRIEIPEGVKQLDVEALDALDIEEE